MQIHQINELLSLYRWWGRSRRTEPGWLPAAAFG
jgi:hypothetical protein